MVRLKDIRILNLGKGKAPLCPKGLYVWIPNKSFKCTLSGKTNCSVCNVKVMSLEKATKLTRSIKTWKDRFMLLRKYKVNIDRLGGEWGNQCHTNPKTKSIILMGTELSEEFYDVYALHELLHGVIDDIVATKSALNKHLKIETLIADLCHEIIYRNKWNQKKLDRFIKEVKSLDRSKLVEEYEKKRKRFIKK